MERPNNGNRGVPPKSERQILRNYLEMTYKKTRKSQQSRKVNKLRSFLEATIRSRPRLTARMIYNQMRTEVKAEKNRNKSENVKAALNQLKANLNRQKAEHEEKVTAAVAKRNQRFAEQAATAAADKAAWQQRWRNNAARETSEIGRAGQTANLIRRENAYRRPWFSRA